MAGRDDRHGAPLRGERADPGVARQSVKVDAIVFWLVWNAEKSILEVADFIEAITLSAQTALIGRHELARRNISLVGDPRLAD